METAALTDVLGALPAKRWAIQAVDYSTGHTAAKVVKEAAEAAGKEIVLEQYVPLGTTDFGPYITKLERAGGDGLFALVPGADGIAFINQPEQFKLFDSYKTVFGFQMISERCSRHQGTRSSASTATSAATWGADNLRNQAFVRGYEKQFGVAPYSVPADHYLAAQMLFEAVRKAGSVDPQQVRTALDGLSFDSFAGRVSLGADHQLVPPAYVGKVVEQDDRMAFEVVSQLPGEKTHPEPDPGCEL